MALSQSTANLSQVHHLKCINLKPKILLILLTMLGVPYIYIYIEDFVLLYASDINRKPDPSHLFNQQHSKNATNRSDSLKLLKTK